MRIRNNIIDRLEKDYDDYVYTLNIGLKSGESIYIDGITKGEKNGYVHFAKNSSETMLLEIDNSLWRLQASDIESMSIKYYKKSLAEATNFLSNIFFAKGKVRKSVYFFLIKSFVFFAILSVIIAGVTLIFEGGDIMGSIRDANLIRSVMEKALTLTKTAFSIVFIIQIVLFVIDAILPPEEPYRRIKPYRTYADETRFSNILIIISFFIFFQIFQSAF